MQGYEQPQMPAQQQQQKQNPNTTFKQRLYMAFNVYKVGERYYKEQSFELALDRFENAEKVVNQVYPYIQKDPQLKEKTDQFKKTLDFYLKSVRHQIQHKYEFKPRAGFASVDSQAKSAEEIKRWVKEAFAPPQQQQQQYQYQQQRQQQQQQYNSNRNVPQNDNNNNKKKDDKQIVGNELRERVLSEIIDTAPGVKFTDVVGLDSAKQILREIIIIPNLRPDLFTGLRSPPRGLLLFGPPGTGKTMIAKAVATECKCTFFNISASSLTSKYLGESEKLVRALFELAFEKEPSVVFIDEIESILSKRSDSENEAMKRLKTEFLIQFDGVGSSADAKVLIIGATNRPFDLDPAVVRRLPKRVYVGPFNEVEKKGFIKTIIQQNECTITDSQFEQIAKMCTNYSNSDLKELCREAAYEPLRELTGDSLKGVTKLRAIKYEDFEKAIKKVRGTLTKDVLKELEVWNSQFGALN
jgi:spastin